MSVRKNREASETKDRPSRVRGKPEPESSAGRKGNAVWQSLALRPTAIQPKLTVSKRGDPQEQEADHLADRAMRMPIASGSRDEISLSADTSANTQLKSDAGEQEEEKKSQPNEPRAHDDAAEVAPPIVHEALNSPAQPLDPSTRSFMETRFGNDFSQVRVHADQLAAESASALDARALTVNHDIVFGADEYAPQTESGRRLLSHELTHVVQQGASVHLRNAISEKGDLTERHADEVSAVVARGESLSPSFLSGTMNSVHLASTVQRKEATQAPEPPNRLQLEFVPPATTVHAPFN